jgi:hypothetical protein
MQTTNAAATAFGLPTVDVTAGMPTATNYGGMSAYSFGSAYDAALAELKARFPAQFAAIMSQFIDPVTGAMSGASAAGPTQMGMPMQSYAPAYDGGGGGGGGGGSTGGGSSSGKLFGGYTSPLDMINGGGPGKSGTTYSGGILGGLTGGYTSKLDMINGGGPGKSGPTFSSSKATGSNATRR